MEKKALKFQSMDQLFAKLFNMRKNIFVEAIRFTLLLGLFLVFFLPSPMWSRPWEIILHPTLCKSEQRAWLCVLTSAHREGMSIWALEKALLWLLTGNVLQIEEKCFTSRQPVQMLSVRFTAPWPPVASHWRKQQVAYLLLHKRRLDIVPGYELLPAMRW